MTYFLVELPSGKRTTILCAESQLAAEVMRKHGALSFTIIRKGGE